MTDSTIRRRINDILLAVNEPISAMDIRQRGNYPKEIGVINMALKAMQRDCLVREWKPGLWVLRDYQCAPCQPPTRPHKVNGKKVATARPSRKKKPVMKKQEINVPDQTATEPTSQDNQDPHKTERVGQALEDFQNRMRPKPIEDIALKLMVLNRLSDMLDNSISAVLQDIVEDLRRAT